MKKALILAVLALPFLASASIDQNLSYGMSGNSVSELQDLLSSEGCLSVPSTGFFGLLTLKGVECFQSKYNIESTGYFGALSRAQANKIISDATAGSDQAQVAEEGTSTPIVACASGDLFNMNTGAPCNSTSIQQTITQAVNQAVQAQASGTVGSGTVGTQTVGGTEQEYSNDLVLVGKIDPKNSTCFMDGQNTVSSGFGTLNFSSNVLPTKIKEIDATITGDINLVSDLIISGMTGAWGTSSLYPTVVFKNDDVSLLLEADSNTADNRSISFIFDAQIKPNIASSTLQMTVNSITLDNGNTVLGLPVTFKPVTFQKADPNTGLCISSTNSQ